MRPMQPCWVRGQWWWPRWLWWFAPGFLAPGAACMAENHTRLKFLPRALCLNVSCAASSCGKSLRTWFPPHSATATFQVKAVHTQFCPNLFSYFDSLTSLTGWGEFTTTFQLPQHQACQHPACRGCLCILVWKTACVYFASMQML